MAQQNNSNGRIVVGSILIVIGILIFMKNFQLEILNVDLFSWPVILFVLGVLILINHKDSFFGIILIVIGGVNIASHYWGISFNYLIHEYWPFLLILFGLVLIFRRSGHSHTSKFNTLEAENYTADIFTFLSSRTEKIITKNFLGGKITSILGELKIDLRESEIKNDAVEIEMLTIFAGTEIYLPSNCRTVIKSKTIFGGYEEQRSKNFQQIQNEEKVIIIKGLVLFGGGEIKY